MLHRITRVETDILTVICRNRVVTANDECRNKSAGVNDACRNGYVIVIYRNRFVTPVETDVTLNNACRNRFVNSDM